MAKGFIYLFMFAIAALFSQVAVLAAVLALVAIIIMSIIILIAVWRKVKDPPLQKQFEM